MPAPFARRIGTMVLAFGIAGCADAPTRILSPAPLPTQARGPRVDTDSRAIITWSDTANGGAAGIIGDGRDAEGATTTESSVYRGDVCGVHAKIFNTSYASGSGDLVFDPDFNSTSCVERALRVHLPDLASDSGGYVSAGPFLNVRQIWQLDGAVPRAQAMRLNYLGQPGCESLHFDATSYPGSNDVVVSRLNPGELPARWTVESSGAHMAMCSVLVKGKPVASGAPRLLPFRFTVTQVP